MRPLFTIIIIIAVIVLGFVLVRLIAAPFVTELTQEVVVEGGPPLATSTTLIGWRAPAFSLPVSFATTTALADYRGRPLVLLFWTTWNPLAADELKLLEDYLRETPPLFAVLAVNQQEERSAVEAFLRRGKYTLPVAFDTTGAVGEAYGVRVVPAIYFIDAAGIVQEKVVGIIDNKTLVDKSLKIIR